MDPPPQLLAFHALSSIPRSHLPDPSSCLCSDSYLSAQQTDAASQPGKLIHFSAGLDLCHLSEYVLRMCFHGHLPGKHCWIRYFFSGKSGLPAPVLCLLLCWLHCLLGSTKKHYDKSSTERNLLLFFTVVLARAFCCYCFSHSPANSRIMGRKLLKPYNSCQREMSQEPQPETDAEQ